MNTRYASYNDYGFRHLPGHLANSELFKTLREILFEFDWLYAKLETIDIHALIADYSFIPDDPGLCLVQDALRLSTHVLSEDKTQLGGQLLARLLFHNSAEIQTMLANIPKTIIVP